MYDIAAIKAHLRYVADRPKKEAKEEEILESLRRLKATAVQAGDQEEAKLIWCYEEILGIQNNYLSAFEEMKNASFYPAWCALERVEIEMDSLQRHLDIAANGDEYKLSFIKAHAARFQTLYPYKLFISPGMLDLEMVCTICNKPITIRNHCGHEVGEIYDGEMCCRGITKVRLLETSLVPNPVQKYSVPFLVDPKTNQQIDHYNYSLVSYV